MRVHLVFLNASIKWMTHWITHEDSYFSPPTVLTTVCNQKTKWLKKKQKNKNKKNKAAIKISRYDDIKWHLLCKIHFYIAFEHKCVLEVCVHHHPIMIKTKTKKSIKNKTNPPYIMSTVSEQAILRFGAMWHTFAQAPSTTVD